MQVRRLMRKMRKSFRYGEKGFTLIELLIVVAILGILAAVVLPNVGGFLETGNLAAANSEAAAVKTAAAAYNADNNGTWPANSGALTAYLDRTPEVTYTFNTSNGLISGTGAGKWATLGFTFSTANQTWHN